MIYLIIVRDTETDDTQSYRRATHEIPTFLDAVENSPFVALVSITPAP